jgi:quercetin dioxygenase-like cupin family protein
MCQVRHTGICFSGRMTVRMDDGTEATVGPGDVMLIEPGHDAWVVGEEPCVLYDTGVAAYAKPR